MNRWTIQNETAAINAAAGMVRIQPKLCVQQLPTSPQTISAWRYAHNRASDRVSRETGVL